MADTQSSHESLALQANRSQPEKTLPAHRSEDGLLKRPRTPGLPLGHDFYWPKAELRKPDLHGSIRKANSWNTNPSSNAQEDDTLTLERAGPQYTSPSPPNAERPEADASNSRQDPGSTPEPSKLPRRGLHRPQMRITSGQARGSFGNKAPHESRFSLQEPASCTDTHSELTSASAIAPFLQRPIEAHAEEHDAGVVPPEASRQSSTALILRNRVDTTDCDMLGADPEMLYGETHTKNGDLQPPPDEEVRHHPNKSATTKTVPNDKTDTRNSKSSVPEAQRQNIVSLTPGSKPEIKKNTTNVSKASSRIEFSRATKNRSKTEQIVTRTGEAAKRPSASSASTSDHFNTVDSLSSTIKSQHQDLERYRNIMSTYTTQCGDMERRNVVLERELQQVKEANSVLETTLEVEVEKTAGYEVSSKELARSISSTAKDLQGLKHSYESLQAEHRYLNEVETPQLRLHHSELRNRLDVALEESAESRRAHHQVVCEAALLAERKKDLDKQLSEMAGLLAEERDRVSRLQSESLGANASHEKLESLIVGMQNEFVKRMTEHGSSLDSIAVKTDDHAKALTQKLSAAQISTTNDPDLTKAITSLRELFIGIVKHTSNKLDQMDNGQERLVAAGSELAKLITVRFDEVEAGMTQAKDLREELHDVQMAKLVVEKDLCSSQTRASELLVQKQKLSSSVTELNVQLQTYQKISPSASINNEKQLTEATLDRALLRNQLSDLKDENWRLLELRKNTEKESQQIREHLSALEQQLEDCRASKMSLEAQNLAQEQELQKSLEEVRTTRLQCEVNCEAGRRQENLLCEARIHDANRASQCSDEKLRERIDHLERAAAIAVEERTLEVQSLNSKLTDAETQLASVQRDHDAHQSVIGENQSDLSSAQAQVRDLEDRLAREDTRRQTLESAIDALGEEKTGILAKLSKCTAQFEELQVQLKCEKECSKDDEGCVRPLAKPETLVVDASTQTVLLPKSQLQVAGNQDSRRASATLSTSTIEPFKTDKSLQLIRAKSGPPSIVETISSHSQGTPMESTLIDLTGAPTVDNCSSSKTDENPRTSFAPSTPATPKSRVDRSSSPLDKLGSESVVSPITESTRTQVLSLNPDNPSTKKPSGPYRLRKSVERITNDSSKRTSGTDRAFEKPNAALGSDEFRLPGLSSIANRDYLEPLSLVKKRPTELTSQDPSTSSKKTAGALKRARAEENQKVASNTKRVRNDDEGTESFQIWQDAVEEDTAPPKTPKAKRINRRSSGRIKESQQTSPALRPGKLKRLKRAKAIFVRGNKASQQG
ncbi:MAG: hypothetical protein M1828_000670 [Chrysothrix sp. TS-e1954]|nr:MAG: hypothetical protein M1828_000670 [Chrysothrix sp. TS-e1954]